MLTCRAEMQVVSPHPVLHGAGRWTQHWKNFKSHNISDLIPDLEKKKKSTLTCKMFKKPMFPNDAVYLLVFKGSRWTLQATTMNGKIVSLRHPLSLFLCFSPFAPFLLRFHDIPNPPVDHLWALTNETPPPSVFRDFLTFSRIRCR